MKTFEEIIIGNGIYPVFVNRQNIINAMKEVHDQAVEQYSEKIRILKNRAIKKQDYGKAAAVRECESLSQIIKDLL